MATRLTRGGQARLARRALSPAQSRQALGNRALQSQGAPLTGLRGQDLPGQEFFAATGASLQPPGFHDPLAVFQAEGPLTRAFPEGGTRLTPGGSRRRLRGARRERRGIRLVTDPLDPTETLGVSLASKGAPRVSRGL